MCASIQSLTVTSEQTTQVGALADVLVQLPELQTLQLGSNDLDDQAFALLSSKVCGAFTSFCIFACTTRCSVSVL